MTLLLVCGRRTGHAGGSASPTMGGYLGDRAAGTAIRTVGVHTTPHAAEVGRSVVEHSLAARTHSQSAPVPVGNGIDDDREHGRYTVADGTATVADQSGRFVDIRDDQVSLQPTVQSDRVRLSEIGP
ncbi:hypothetical protein OG947_17010 [Rhodococcus sp. NBC_00297]|nr:hypothetical protein [Rhodococcus sp. NBC_00297]